MDDDEPQKTYPLSPAKMSKTPSWVMLGFLLGAAFVWAFKSEVPKPAAATTAATVTRQAAAAEPARVALTTITTIEAVFAEWGHYAVWENDLSELALWNSETKRFSEFYEVRRTGDAYYFRSISKLTRLIIRHGKPLPNSPLQFTETEAQYRDWLENGRQERPDERTLPVSPRRPEFTNPVPPTITPPRIEIGARPELVLPTPFPAKP